MIVVSDTSPLTALLTVGKAEILIQLFSEVVIPTAVEAELRRYHTALPKWLRVEPVRDSQQAARFAETVDLGEAEAIVLAQELKADQLLMDERKGRRLAIAHGLHVIGLVGVILAAKQKRLIPSARDCLNRLETEAGVYMSPDLKREALASIGE